MKSKKGEVWWRQLIKETSDEWKARRGPVTHGKVKRPEEGTKEYEMSNIQGGRLNLTVFFKRIMRF